MRKNRYRSTTLANVKIPEMVARLSEGTVCVGLDISKAEVLAVVRSSAGTFERPWKVKQPSEVQLLVSVIGELSRHRPVVVAMEPTRTYGDALRQALCDAGISVRRVGGKSVSDYAEIFDGVPSAHDGKDAAMVAELAAIGKSHPWSSVAATDWEAEVAGHVQWQDTQQEIWQLWLGRLEGLVSRHWPELTGLLALRSPTLLRVLAEYGGPARVAADAGAREKIAGWGGHYLKAEKVERLLASARTTVGVRMHAEEMEQTRRFAQQALAARTEVRRAQQALQRLAEQQATVKRMAQVVGSATACVLYTTVGDPGDYPCAAAYRKAMGLNLKERSSGKYQGKLKISKRGSSLARRWLFFAALRCVQQAPVRGWFEQKKRKDQDRGLGAVVGVMRKLALAVHAVAVGTEDFAVERLFPGRSWPRQTVATPGASGPPDPRDLSLRSKNQRGRKEAVGSLAPPPEPPVFAPGPALGSIPTVALSSGQAPQS